MKLGLETHPPMSPERERAWAMFNALGMRSDQTSTLLSATLGALEEVEHFRPVIEVAKALVDARSGEARALAIEGIVGAVRKLRESGR